MQQIRPQKLATWLADPERAQPLLLDVREAWEVAQCQIPGSVHIPMHTIPLRHAELPAERDIVLICHHGGRSMQIAMFLERQGCGSVFNLLGGVEGWACEVDPSMNRY
jgi:rhodanese-related sulfurtransferase